MWRKVLYLIALFLLAEWLVSCCECPDDEVYYSLCSLTLTPLDNSGQSPVAADTLHIPGEAFGIRLKLSLQQGMCQIPSHASLFHSAYALSCECREDNLMVTAPDSISIITQFDLNASYPAGSDVTELFRVVSDNEMISAFDYFRRQAGPSLSAHIHNNEISADALLMSQMIPGQHQFEIRFYLTNSEPIIASTPLLLVQ